MYRLDDSDSDDDDYDGFSFGDDYDQEGNRIRRNKPTFHFQSKPEDDIKLKLLNCAETGDVDDFRRIFKQNQKLVQIDDGLSDDWTALMFACHRGHLELVRCLIDQFDANINKLAYSGTPLLLVCSADKIPEETVLEIVKILLDKKAVVNTRNRNGEMPLMVACANGFESVVNLLLPLATLEAFDNCGKTALFYAVENNRYNIVKLLINHGAITTVRNRFGDDVKQLAICGGFTDIEALFPEEEGLEMIPGEYLSYLTYQDLLPTGYPDVDKPAYIQDVFSLLQGMRVSDLDIAFFKAKISLSELLCATDESLQQIGVNFPFQRNRIVLGLLKFHEKRFVTTSLHRPDKTGSTKLNQYFDIFAGCVKHLFILRCTLAFVESKLINKDTQLTPKSKQYIKDINKLLVEILSFTRSMQQQIEKIDKRTPKPPPLLIDQSLINYVKAKGFLKRVFIKSTVILGLIGVGAVIYAVIKKRF